jgi:K+-sensing histidine kinase KdpD
VADDLKDELKPFTLKATVQEEMPLVKLDFGLMEQVLYNLLVNSTQYAPPASDILLSVSFSEEKMVIEISDTGPGFPEQEIKNVFKKFFRVNENKTGGLGLGLSIAKGFVEAHGGTIHVENREEGGARFIIKIPTEKPDIKNLQEAYYE